MSVLLRPVVAATDLHLCAAACTLALAAACETTAGVRPAVKWPNDLVVDDAKLAGVLSESDRSAPGGAPGSTAVVVGMGCNLTWSGPPDVVGTCLADLAGRPVGRDELLDATLAHLARRLGALSEVGGRGGLMDELRRSCATVGRQVRVERGAGADLVGEAVAVTDAGHLVVRQAAGDVEVAAGDVVHLRDVRK